MSLVARSLELFAGLPAQSIVLMLVSKWTVVLALAWLAHAMLAGRNPRWRVVLWRWALVGLATVAVFSVFPPFVTYQSAARDSTLTEVVQTTPIAPAVAGQEATAMIVDREPTISIRRGAPISAPAATAVNLVPGETRVGPWLWSIWLAGVLVLTARLIVGSLGLARVIRRSAAVPDEMVRESRMIAGRLSYHRTVRVLRSADVATPCLAGLWRPVLLLPERECDALALDDLRAILAHELTHARNQDLAWSLGIRVASIVLWFHPLVWRFGAAYVAACDAECDAAAVDVLGDVTSYGRTLARLAVRAAWPSSAHGLAMARTSDVRRRLDALNRNVFRASLSWKRVVPSLAIGSVFVVLIGGFGFTRAEQVDAPHSAVAAQTGRPSTGVSNEFRARGRVVDSGGRPVQGARALIGPSIWDANLPAATTAAKGEFVLEQCAEGSTIVTVRADGFAPELRDVFVGERLEPLAFRLQPAAELRLRVVDALGKPVAGAFVFAQTWRRYHTLDLREKTDSEGRFTWRSAPRDAVLYDFGKSGFMSRRALPLIASEREQVVTLYPKLEISGRVTDAATDLAVPKWVLIQGVGFKGRDKISWSRDAAKLVTGALYVATFDEPNDTMYVRIEALGYQPAVSRAYRADEGSQKFDFALVRAETVAGIVQIPDGKPAEGVEVILVTEADQVLFKGGHFESRTSSPRFKTSSDGRFAFTAPNGDFALIALGDAGYTDASPAEFAKSDKLVLEPWGRLEGELMAGRRPKANEAIHRVGVELRQGWPLLDRQHHAGRL